MCGGFALQSNLAQRCCEHVGMSRGERLCSRVWGSVEMELPGHGLCVCSVQVVEPICTPTNGVIAVAPHPGQHLVLSANPSFNKR